MIILILFSMISNRYVVFLDDHIFFLSILKNLVKSLSGHAEKPLWFDKFFDLQSFLMMVVLLLLLYENDKLLQKLAGIAFAEVQVVKCPQTFSWNYYSH